MMPEVKEWYDLANTDLQVAKHLNDSFHPKPLEIICFHCQQAAEKAAKSLIVYYGAEGGIPKLHDISFLLDQIKNKVRIEEKYYEYADVLTPYGVVARYPNELFLDERHTEQAIQYADSILQWVNGIIAIQE